MIFVFRLAAVVESSLVSVQGTSPFTIEEGSGNIARLELSHMMVASSYACVQPLWFCLIIRSARSCTCTCNNVIVLLIVE